MREKRGVVRKMEQVDGIQEKSSIVMIWYPCRQRLSGFWRVSRLIHLTVLLVKSGHYKAAAPKIPRKQRLQRWDPPEKSKC
jgi:hypothetical protein